MGNSTSKAFLMGGCCLLFAWGISRVTTSGSKTQPPIPTQDAEAVSYNPSYGMYPGASREANTHYKQWKDAQNGNPRQYSSNSPPTRGRYHYEVTITDARREWETYEKETLINGEIRLKKTSSDISEINGTYIWDMDEYLPNEDAMFNYILSNYSRMKRYKVNPQSSRTKYKGYYPNDADEFNDRLDDYLLDPEDEAEFPPEIFDYLDD